MVPLLKTHCVAVAAGCSPRQALAGRSHTNCGGGQSGFSEVEARSIAEFTAEAQRKGELRMYVEPPLLRRYISYL